MNSALIANIVSASAFTIYFQIVQCFLLALGFFSVFFVLFSFKWCIYNALKVGDSSKSTTSHMSQIFLCFRTEKKIVIFFVCVCVLSKIQTTYLLYFRMPLDNNVPNDEAWCGTWQPTRRRGPISAEFKGPILLLLTSDSRSSCVQSYTSERLWAKTIPVQHCRPSLSSQQLYKNTRTRSIFS